MFILRFRETFFLRAALLRPRDFLGGYGGHFSRLRREKWRRRESNPRPKIFFRGLYMRVQFPLSFTFDQLGAGKDLMKVIP